jgi:hypothetical protein
VTTDFLAQHRPPADLPSGEYAVKIVPQSAAPFRSAQSEGCSYRVEIVEGPAEGRVVRLRVLSVGPPSMEGFVGRDMRVLAAWANAVDAAPAVDLVGVVRSLWMASKGRRVWLNIVVRSDPLGVTEATAKGVRVEAIAAPPTEHGADGDPEYPF